jgi:LAO/AO transport system kinase
LDGAGFDIILIETVGAGQAEVEIASLAHSVVVVEAPGFGDEIQAIKAGILEIADILVVNKADQPGALRTESALMAAFHASERPAYRHHSDIDQSGSIPESSKDGWQIPILRTNAIDGEGVDTLCEQLILHGQFLQKNGQWQERESLRLRHEFEKSVRETLYQHWRESITETEYRELMAALANRTTAPQMLAKKVASESLTSKPNQVPPQLV